MNDPLHDVTNSVVTQLRRDLGPKVARVMREEDKKEALRRRVKDAEDRAIDAVNQLVATQRHIGRWFAGIAFVAFVFGFILGWRLA
jgi:folate-dependent phosphoribosylglycinamide formyltransferase PurN